MSSASDSVTTSAGLPSAISCVDVAIEQPMRLAVEVVGREHVADLVGGLVVEKQAAQHRLLRFHRMRWQLDRFELRVVGHGGSSVGPRFYKPGRNSCR